MALTTYSELKTTIADFLNRDDLTSIIPTFITLAESQINRDIRHWRMEKRATSAVDSEYVSLPTDWIETISVHLQGGGTTPVNFASRDSIADKRAAGYDTAGRPEFYTHSDGALELYPTPADTYTLELLYASKIDALSDSNTSNWLLLDSPDAYLYGALVHSAPYLQEDGRANTWAQLYGAAVQAVNLSSERSRNSGTGLRLKVKGMGGSIRGIVR